MKMTVKANKLEELTAIAKRGLEDAARAVFEIHEEKLYLEKYSTFEEWLQSELGLQRRRGYELLEAHTGYQKLESANVRNSAHSVSVHAAQAVSRVPDEYVAEVIEAATEGGTKPATAAAVKRVAGEIVTPHVTPDVTPDVTQQPDDTPSAKFRKLRSVAKQHNAAMIRAIDSMNDLILNPGTHRKLVQHYEAIDKLLEGWPV
jgi:predicted subunit of tRNA(5-methylaminomethyl-2-thiouridylate) methyltransferase